MLAVCYMLLVVHNKFPLTCHLVVVSILPNSQKSLIMQWAHQQGIDMRILSDCNSVFISHMLTGAKVNTRVQEVITNLSSFVRCPSPTDAQTSPTQSPREPDSAHSDAESSTASPHKVQLASTDAIWAAANGKAAGDKAPASHRMVVQPRHDWTVASHGCPLCPANLCKASPCCGSMLLFQCCCSHAAGSMLLVQCCWFNAVGPMLLRRCRYFKTAASTAAIRQSHDNSTSSLRFTSGPCMSALQVAWVLLMRWTRSNSKTPD